MSTTPPNPDKKSPTRLSAGRQGAGQYYLMEKIAQGGMAEIFKGLSYDAHGLKRTVCIKKILPHIAASREFIDSLIDEAKIAVTLSHGNIAHTYDLGKVAEDYFIVMEYVDGKSLSQLAKRAITLGTKIPLPIVCALIADAAAALDYIHRRTAEDGTQLHIVHRDISPQNIMVSFSGTLKIIDFGIAIAATRTGMTDAGMLKGKFSYMSPEQARGDTIDHRSDIFSLGIIFHELLTGKRLFKGDDHRMTLRNVRRARADAPSLIDPTLPIEIDRIALLALAKDRRHRYHSASDFRDDLLKYLHTSHPEFQTSDIVNYLRELFRQELTDRENRHEELQTPHLIIEGTQSALLESDEQEATGLGEAPLDMSEFLLEEIEPKPYSSPEPSADLKSTEPEEKTTTRTAFWLKTNIRWIVLGIGGAAIALLLFWIGREMFFLHRERPLPPQIVAVQPVAPPMEQPKRPTELLLASTPSGALVYIDERETPQTTPAAFKDLAAGKHTLGLFLPNHRFWKREILITESERLRLEVALEKDWASLVVTSEPAGALVLIDGVPAGQTPLTREQLEPGKTLHVEVWLEGHQPDKQDLKLFPGRQTEIRAVLPKTP
ncbi:MAG: protein kinase [Deltaproteobacteria bacterium]|nr:protein kinase [Deltaproteobacteria bacterium]